MEATDLDDVDLILKDLGGTFSRFQIYNYLMLSFSMFVTGTFVLDYVFATLQVDHRCKIPQCDKVDAVVLNEDWLKYAVPFKDGQPDSCYRYETVESSHPNGHFCDVQSFDRTKIINCANETLHYSTDEVSIINEFNLVCADYSLQIAMVGTWSNVGRLLFLPIVGYLSDRIGRKNILIGSCILGSMIKILKSVASTYNSFVVLEMLDSGICSAIYPAALILGMELATTEHNIFAACIILASYPMGQVVTALIASYVHNYKTLLKIISLFGLATFPFIFVLPESLRWLLVKRKYEAAIKWIDRASKINGITISSKCYEIISKKCAKNSDEIRNNECHGSFMDILKSCSLFSRLIICAFCWISSAFITYGVSIMSTSLQGDKYVNFMVVSFAGLPGIFLTFYMLIYVNRRWSMCASFIASGLSIFASKYYDWNATISLIFFFLGKFFINHTFTSLYLYTNELWPTVLRHSVLGICSMIGRFGSIGAPMTPMLGRVMAFLPFYLFSGFAFLSGIMILLLPETFRQKKLPDSINDIKQLNNKSNTIISA